MSTPKTKKQQLSLISTANQWLTARRFRDTHGTGGFRKPAPRARFSDRVYYQTNLINSLKTPAL